MENKIALTPEVVECVNELQTGGAELWDGVIRKAISCTVRNDGYEDAEERLKLVQELMYMQDKLSVFIDLEGGAK